MLTNSQNMKLNLTGVKTRFYFLLLTLVPALGFAQDSDSTVADTINLGGLTPQKAEPVSPFGSYFQPLNSDEIARVKSGWNTAGVYNDYKQVPNYREISGSNVHDPHSILQKSGIDTLNKIIQMIEDSTSVQMAVVCLYSIGSNDPHTFSTDLFNHWGIGSSQNDNGILITVFVDIHKSSTILGYGMEGEITDLETAEIRENEMVPFFKKDDYTTGLIRGVQVYAEVLMGIDPAYLRSDYNVDEYDQSADYAYEDYDQPSTPFFQRPLVRLYLRIGVLLSAAWLIVLMISFFVRDLHRRYHLLKFFTLLIFPILYPVPFLGLYFLNRSLMNKWRNTERFSKNTGEYMHKLSESEDDEFLQKGQVKEEVLKSIDYDVWVTEDKSEVLILKYKRWFSKYRKCPKCKHLTFNKDYDRVITAATYSSSGTGQRKYSCKSCNHSKITTYTIPRKQQSSGGSSGGYSGGSSYSSSSSSSSSSGGSSYGGGSSGGGGSTGGW